SYDLRRLARPMAPNQCWFGAIVAFTGIHPSPVPRQPSATSTRPRQPHPPPRPGAPRTLVEGEAGRQPGRKWVGGCALARGAQGLRLAALPYPLREIRPAAAALRDRETRQLTRLPVNQVGEPQLAAAAQCAIGAAGNTRIRAAAGGKVLGEARHRIHDRELQGGTWAHLGAHPACLATRG